MRIGAGEKKRDLGLNKKPFVVATPLAALLALATIAAPAAVVFAINLDGGSGNDTLNGTGDPDTIRGFGGNDLIRGFGSSDSLYGGVGDDEIYGGSGGDRIYGWHGNNRLDGGSGGDVMFATGCIGCPTQYNYIFGRGGSDRVTVNGAGATVYGGDGSDRIEAVADSGTGGFLIYGGNNDDHVRVVDNAADVYGGSGADTIIATGEAIHDAFGGSGGDTITVNTDVPSNARGGSGDDRLINDFEGNLRGEDGDDIIESTSGASFTDMRGGSGADEFRCNGSDDTVHDYDPAEGDVLAGTCETVL